MEEKLRTLKDLMDPFRKNDLKAKMFEAIVKAEAIKWVKDIDNGMSAKIWIREFFNLTEEDLK